MKAQRYAILISAGAVAISVGVKWRASRDKNVKSEPSELLRGDLALKVEPRATGAEPESTSRSHIPPAPPSPVAYSREDARRYLDDLVAQTYPKGETIPRLDFRPEDSASPEEKIRILEYRKAAQQKGILLIAARAEDGSLHFSESPGEFPREFVPANIRKNLTDEDWEVFQVSMEVASVLKHGFGRARRTGTEAPNKAPEPTPVAVTPRATEGTSK